jgi:Bacterial EndoU nuclease
MTTTNSPTISSLDTTDRSQLLITPTCGRAPSFYTINRCRPTPKSVRGVGQLVHPPVAILDRPTIDFEHVFDGEIGRDGRAEGFHHEGTEHNNLHSRVIKNIKPPNAMGVYIAIVAIYDKISRLWVAKECGSTMFPKEWSRKRIETEIRSAYNNQIPVLGQQKWAGLSSSGLTIEGYWEMGPDMIKTAYPKYDDTLSHGHRRRARA